jgi:hypothetical protein
VLCDHIDLGSDSAARCEVHWQDIVISLCQILFLFSFIPSFRGSKPAAATSVMNVALVLAITVSQATLGLWFSASTSTLVAACWAALAVQKISIDRSARSAAVG